MSNGALATKLAEVKNAAGVSGAELAELLDTTPETVSRWQTGRTEPRRANLDLLLQLNYLVAELAELYAPDEARLWLFSRHKQLQGQRPADLIRQGRIADVQGIISQLQDSAHV